MDNFFFNEKVMFLWLKVVDRKLNICKKQVLNQTLYLFAQSFLTTSIT